MLLELINYIEIGERKEVDGLKCRDVVIHYTLLYVNTSNNFYAHDGFNFLLNILK
uniref:hypothetical protein n=1 Tax=Alkaliphilus oremlandii TaxID=461876 RepID=UPI000301C428